MNAFGGAWNSKAHSNNFLFPAGQFFICQQVGEYVHTFTKKSRRMTVMQGPCGLQSPLGTHKKELSSSSNKV